MGKRKSRRGRDFLDVEDSEGSDGSVMSRETADSLALDRSASQLSTMSLGTIEEQLNKILEDLGDKTRSVREGALVKLIRKLSTSYLGEESAAVPNTLVIELLKSLRAGGNEGILAAKSLSLVWITFGSNPSDFTTAIQSLRLCIKNGHDVFRCAAIHALSMISFMEEVDAATCSDIMKVFKDIFDSDAENDEIQASLEAFGLLYSKGQTHLGRIEFNALVDRHFELLEKNDNRLRIAAGENIALFLEIHEMEIAEKGEVEEESYYEKFHELVIKLTELTKGS